MDTYTFENTQEGQTRREHLANVFNLSGREVRESEIEMVHSAGTTTLLCLEVGPRKDEGKIAQSMKARKS